MTNTTQDDELLDFVLPVPQQTPVSRKEQILMDKTLSKRAKANKMLQDLINKKVVEELVRHGANLNWAIGSIEGLVGHKPRYLVDELERAKNRLNKDNEDECK